MNNKQIIFRPHSAGFFSIFNKVIQGLAIHTDEIKKVVWDMNGAGMDQYSCGEVYSKLFEEYNIATEQDELETIIIEKYIDVNYTAHHVADIYQQANQDWRKIYNNAFNKFIKFTPFLQNVWNETFQVRFNKCASVPKIGVLIRNAQLSTEQPNRSLPTRSQYIQAINDLKLERFEVVCAVDNKDDLSFFANSYNCIYNTSVTRTEHPYEPEPHLRGGLTVKDAAFHFIEGYNLSKCDYIIHPVSNIATAAMYMNPDLKSTFLIG